MDCRQGALLGICVPLLLGMAILKGCAAGNPPTKSAQGSDLELFWNVWAEDQDEPRFQPVPNLKPNGRYRIALDLAAFQYREAGAIGMPTSQAFRNEVAKWLKPGMPPPTLKILLLADRGRVSVDPSAKDLAVDLIKMRRVWQSGLVKATEDHFRILRAAYEEGVTPNFEFGSVFFDVQTAGREGLTTLSFSVWYQDRPIDEISVQMCVAGSTDDEKRLCGAASNIIPQGLNAVRVACQSDKSPAAAIHFIALSSDAKVVGVLHLSSWARNEFVSWQLSQSAEEFRKNISKQLEDLGRANNEETLLADGEALFALLFPTSAIVGDGSNIREHVLNFLLPYFRQDPSLEAYQPPSIFVRMIQAGPSPSSPIPLGLMAARLDDKNKLTRSNGRFLGEYFLIENSLETQNYQSPNKCVSRWAMLLPPRRCK